MKREKYLDIARGIATIMVVIGHCDYHYTELWLTTWVYSFHMPLFFIISGMLFRPEKYDNFKHFLKKKFKGLVVPYLIFSLITFVVSLGVEFAKTKGLDGGDALKSFAGIFVGWRGTKWYNGLWFISALFFSEILVYGVIWISRKAKESRGKWLLPAITMGLLVGGFALAVNVKGAPFSVDLVPLSAAIIIIGYGVKKLCERIKWMSGILMSIIMLGINIATCVWNYNLANSRVDMYSSVFGNWALFIISAISGSLVILNISKMIKENRVLEKIGRRSLTYYALQGTIALPAAKGGWVFVLRKLSLPNVRLVSCFIITTASCVILAICSGVLEKISPKIFGRNK